MKDWIEKILNKIWMVPEDVARRLFFMQRKRFLRRLQVMAWAHLPLSDSIAELKERAFQSKNGVMYAALASMDYRLRRGRSMSETFSGWIPETQIMLMQAGDRIGYEAFADAIEDVIALQNATKEMIGRVIGGIVEPTILLIANYLLILWMAQNFTAKVFSMMNISPDQLTGQARQFYNVGVFAQSHWAWILPSVIAVLLALLFLSLPIAKGKWRRPLDRFVPPWSIYRTIVGSGWMLAFSKLLKSGSSYEEIMHRTAALAKPWLRSRIHSIEYWIKRGQPLGEAMKKTGDNFPSRDLIDDISTFDNRPNFQQTLDVLAREWIKSATQQIKVLAFAITAFGWVITGGSLIWIFTAFDAVQTQITVLAQQAH